MSEPRSAAGLPIVFFSRTSALRNIQTDARYPAADFVSAAGVRGRSL
jgi:hypothetical protein